MPCCVFGALCGTGASSKVLPAIFFQAGKKGKLKDRCSRFDWLMAQLNCARISISNYVIYPILILASLSRRSCHQRHKEKNVIVSSLTGFPYSFLSELFYERYFIPIEDKSYCEEGELLGSCNKHGGI